MGNLISHPLNSEDVLMLQLSLGLTDPKFKKLITRWSRDGEITEPSAMEQASEMKKKCLPANVEYHEDCSRVKLQDLLDHTAQRLLLTFPENVILEMESELVLTTKWGIADTENPFKNWKITILEHFADYGLFMTALAPMKLANSSGKVHFKCTKKSLLCLLRPVKLEFQELSQEWIDYEKEEIQKEIDALKPSEVEMHGKNFVIKHEVLLCKGEKEPAREDGSRRRRRLTAQQVPLPVDDLCEQAYGMGEELLMDYLDTTMKGRMAVANREAFDTCMAASDPYMNAKMTAKDQSPQ